jgi:uncharacterized membrane protein YfcA
VEITGGDCRMCLDQFFSGGSLFVLDSSVGVTSICLCDVDRDCDLYISKKNFGQVHVALSITPRVLMLAAIGSLLIGFYDGIFGPGTGSFFIFFFIRFLNVDFLHASALSKIGNFMTNIAALELLAPTGHVIFQIGLMMAVANVIGSIVGVRVALKYGSGFVRIIFLILVSILICRIGYQMFVTG